MRSAAALACLLACSLLPGPTKSDHPRMAQSGSTATLEAKLDKRLAQFDSSGQALIPILLHLAYQNHLPMGIEYVDRDALARPIRLHASDESIRNILTAAVGQLSEFQISYSQGVVLLYSPSGRKDAENLLNKAIPDFVVTGMDTQAAGAELTCALTRVASPGSGCFASIAKGEWGPLKITLRARNERVREILDDIVVQNGNAVWTVTVPPEKLSALPIVNLWHIYPLQSRFEGEIAARLAGMFQQTSDSGGT